LAREGRLHPPTALRTRVELPRFLAIDGLLASLRVSLSDHLQDLYKDLDKFDAWAQCPWHVGVVFNALLAATQGEVQENAAVSAIEPLERGREDDVVARASCGSIRVLTNQLYRAVAPQQY
jgi:hypothetical protein